MSYRIRNGKLEKSGTKITLLDYVPTGYRESDAEKAARVGDVVALERCVYEDGTIKYCVPGLEPDTAATLVAAGLIKCQSGENGERITTILESHNPRVLAWQAGVNQFGCSQGIDEIFPGAPIATQMPKAGHA